MSEAESLVWLAVVLAALAWGVSELARVREKESDAKEEKNGSCQEI